MAEQLLLREKVEPASAVAMAKKVAQSSSMAEQLLLREMVEPASAAD